MKRKLKVDLFKDAWSRQCLHRWLEARNIEPIP
jgi:hypothetical protein